LRNWEKAGTKNCVHPESESNWSIGPKRHGIDRSGRKEASKEKHNRKPAYPTTVLGKTSL